MKNFIVIICLTLFLWPTDLFSQDQKEKRFQVNLSYLQVTSRLRGFSDSGIGLGAEYQFPIVKKIGLNGLGGLGYELLPNCTTCYSEWFQNGYWMGIGLSKTIQVKSKDTFMAQLRYRRVGFERNEASLLNGNGEVIRYDVADHGQEVFGLRLGYILPLKMPLVLSYTYEKASFHWINSLALGIRL
ncbi:hypothetical protein SAMN03080617_00012 [Algoriphagus alkaliphilus]|uniref:Outer membrane protein beta-barrel domain-containing protein n=1 Tax=Algoriphagus alkaliphilus TaxID=279824 RepID=A0A1G5UU50_9BACT|nr:hypothetical protein [Algoriphagus alkaliphilus]MBA4300073.1 hypothetical protein [Cyclobacterium sp.]SDA37153.1 hypothetical protein SAMN03080617_00012 [Algoriphagus alkaliphilus]